ncbi:MAG TPA: hypothetical protein DIU15_20875 [Deltaproteobacteria bacterium]|nr:hypothetical protein [Deltaproteobacteria bacterium]HCP48504.1 hypothetical protein [Deltaproteobacteria bacterium]
MLSTKTTFRQRLIATLRSLVWGLFVLGCIGCTRYQVPLHHLPEDGSYLIVKQGPGGTRVYDCQSWSEDAWDPTCVEVRFVKRAPSNTPGQGESQ